MSVYSQHASLLFFSFFILIVKKEKRKSILYFHFFIFYLLCDVLFVNTSFTRQIKCLYIF